MTNAVRNRPGLTDEQPRCWRCHKKLANALARPWDITCPRCGARNVRRNDEQVN